MRHEHRGDAEVALDRADLLAQRDADLGARGRPAPTDQGLNDAGARQFGPSGASIWNTPAIDAKRHQLYVGTGDNYPFTWFRPELLFHEQPFMFDATTAIAPDASAEALRAVLAPMTEQQVRVFKQNADTAAKVLNSTEDSAVTRTIVANLLAGSTRTAQ